MQESQIIITKHTSKVLEGNPRNDPIMRKLPVYLPPNYDPSQTYPTAYMLTGIGFRGMKLLNDSLWEENIQDRLDRLILSGEILPLIAVLPDCSTSYGGAQYLNTSALGNYQDYLLELVDYVDATYSTVQDPAYRIIMGHSSGGYGATIMGMMHPEVFGNVADHSGDKNFETGYKPDFLPFLIEYEKMGAENFPAFVADPIDAWTYKKPFILANTISMAACYSPNPESEFGFDFPFDMHTGELIPEVWQRWLAHDPVYLIDQYADALRSLNFYYLDCGAYDQYNLQFSARIYVRELQKHNIPHFYEEYPDGHNNVYYRFDTSLKLITDKIKTLQS